MYCPLYIFSILQVILLYYPSTMRIEKGKGAGLQFISSDTALLTAQFPQIIGPIHASFHLNSPGSIQPGCSLVHRPDQLTMPSLPSLYHVLHL